MRSPNIKITSDHSMVISLQLELLFRWLSFSQLIHCNWMINYFLDDECDLFLYLGYEVTKSINSKYGLMSLLILMRKLWLSTILVGYLLYRMWHYLNFQLKIWIAFFWRFYFLSTFLLLKYCTRYQTTIHVFGPNICIPTQSQDIYLYPAQSQDIYFFHFSSTIWAKKISPQCQDFFSLTLIQNMSNGCSLILYLLIWSVSIVY